MKTKALYGDKSMKLDEVIDMITDCIQRKSKLNEWESNFIHSIFEETYYKRKSLSKNQMAILDRIWERTTE